MRVTRERFEELVAQALDALPEEFAELLENVAVVVEEEPGDDDLREVEIDPEDPDRDELFGIYQGVPLADRDILLLPAPRSGGHLPRPHPPPLHQPPRDPP